MTVWVRPHEPKHRYQRRDILRTVIAMQNELPQRALTVQRTHDIAQRCLRLLRGHDRDQNGFNGLDGMVPSIRSVRIAPVGSSPRLLQLRTRHILRGASVTESRLGCCVNPSDKAVAVTIDLSDRTAERQNLVERPESIRHKTLEEPLKMECSVHHVQHEIRLLPG